jgi:hypothetical protein
MAVLLWFEACNGLTTGFLDRNVVILPKSCNDPVTDETYPRMRRFLRESGFVHYAYAPALAAYFV